MPSKNQLGLHQEKVRAPDLVVSAVFRIFGILPISKVNCKMSRPKMSNIESLESSEVNNPISNKALWKNSRRHHQAEATYISADEVSYDVHVEKFTHLHFLSA